MQAPEFFLLNFPSSYKGLNFEVTCTVRSMHHSLDLYSEILLRCTESWWEVTRKLIHSSFLKESVPILRYELSHIFPCKSISLILLMTVAPQVTHTQFLYPIHTTCTSILLSQHWFLGLFHLYVCFTINFSWLRLAQSSLSNAVGCRNANKRDFLAWEGTTARPWELLTFLTLLTWSVVPVRGVLGFSIINFLQNCRVV